MSNKPELDWMREAKRHLGMHEKTHEYILKDWLIDLNVTWLTTKAAWCGTFVAKVFKDAGLKYPKEFYRAASWRNFGTELISPCYGAVAVKRRKGGDHVCLIVGASSDGRLVCIGGNQSDSVCYALYNTSDFDSFRWAGKMSKPANHRYKLDLISFNNKLNIKVRED